MFEATQTHCGQYKRYGDFFREWAIKTDLPKGEALKRCFDELNEGRILPESAEWHKNVRHGGDKFSDAGYYFRGYYTIEKTETGYHFSICEPFAD